MNIFSNKLIKQFAKYMVGGGIYFWSGYAVFAFCFSVLGLWWFWAKVAADVVGWTLNYFVQRYWAFASDHMRLSEMQHVGRYITIVTVGFVLDYLIIAGLYQLGLTPYIGFFIAAGFFTVWNFLWYKFWVFPEEHSTK